MSTILSILHIGLPLDHPSIPADLRPKVEKGLREIQADMTQSGLKYQEIYYSPESGLDGFAKQLQEQPCDGVVIGGGVTNSPQMTYFMEQIIDVTRTHAPTAKIMFIRGADVSEVRKAVSRWLKI